MKNERLYLHRILVYKSTKTIAKMRQSSKIKTFLKSKCITLTGRKAKGLTKVHHTTKGRFTQLRSKGYNNKLENKLLKPPIKQIDRTGFQELSSPSTILNTSRVKPIWTQGLPVRAMSHWRWSSFIFHQSLELSRVLAQAFSSGISSIKFKNPNGVHNLTESTQ